jgi:hypothetical protein
VLQGLHEADDGGQLERLEQGDGLDQLAVQKQLQTALRSTIQRGEGWCEGTGAGENLVGMAGETLTSGLSVYHN